MLIEFLFVGCVLGVVMVGMLVMIGVLSLEELGNGVWRIFLLAVIALVAFYVLKGLLLPILTMGLIRLKQLMWWVAIIGLVVIAAMFFLRMLAVKFEKWLSAHGNHDRGEL